MSYFILNFIFTSKYAICDISFSLTEIITFVVSHIGYWERIQPALHDSPISPIHYVRAFRQSSTKMMGQTCTFATNQWTFSHSRNPRAPIQCWRKMCSKTATLLRPIHCSSNILDPTLESLKEWCVLRRPNALWICNIVGVITHDLHDVFSRCTTMLHSKALRVFNIDTGSGVFPVYYCLGLFGTCTHVYGTT